MLFCAGSEEVDLWIRCFRAGDKDQASKCWRAAAKGGEVEGMYNLGRMCEAEGQTDMALHYYRASRILEGRYRIYLLTRGTEAIRAPDMLRHALLLQDLGSQTYWLNATVNYCQVNGGGDEEVLAEALYHLGFILFYEGQKDDAMPYVQEAADMGYAAADVLVSEIWAHRGKFILAQGALRRALRRQK